MLEFQEKKKLRSILYSKVTLVALSVIFFFIVKATFGVYYKEKASRENLNIVNERLLELEKREKRLALEVDRLNTDKGAEKEIRKKFMIGKEGENVIVIVDEAKAEKSVKESDKGEKSIWSRFLDFFR